MARPKLKRRGRKPVPAIDPHEICVQFSAIEEPNMTDSVLTHERLSEITGYVREGDIERCLRDQGIPIFRGKKGIFSTERLITETGLIRYGYSNVRSVKEVVR